MFWRVRRFVWASYLAISIIIYPVAVSINSATAIMYIVVAMDVANTGQCRDVALWIVSELTRVL